MSSCCDGVFATLGTMKMGKSEQGERGELPAVKAGSFIQHYEIIRPLGRGGMGQVLLARDTRLGRLVAIKLLTSQGEEHPQRFLIEARRAQREVSIVREHNTLMRPSIAKDLDILFPDQSGRRTLRWWVLVRLGREPPEHRHP